MAEFIHFESEEEDDVDSRDIGEDTDCEDNSDDICGNFIDNGGEEQMEEGYVPPNPYMGQELRLPRGLQETVDRVQRVSFFIVMFSFKYC